MRPAIEVYRCASYEDAKLFGSIEGEETAAAVIKADRAEVRAEVVAEIVAWLNRRAGQVLQLHAEAKTDHERNIVDEHASAIEQCAIEIEAKFGGRDETL